MPYKYDTKFFLNKCLRPFKEFYFAGLESYRKSKKMCFFQFINCVLFFWIIFYIIPQILLDLPNLLSISETANMSSIIHIILLLFLAFVIKVITILVSSANIAFRTLLETKPELTLNITLTSLIILISYYFFYESIKKEIKSFLLNNG